MYEKSCECVRENDQDRSVAEKYGMRLTRMRLV